MSYAIDTAAITNVRIDDPGFALRYAQRRSRRSRLTEDGKLNIVAADHPARRVTRVGPDPLAMADRGDFLGRILRVLASPRVDGVMATMDVLEELLILAALRVSLNQPDPLENKLLIASLNRGGIANAVWEMEDPITGATPQTCAAWNLDGAKLLLRICDDDPGSLRTMEASAQAIRETNALALPMFLEPLPVERTETGFQVIKAPQALASIVGVASALGDSSRHLWLKLPYCEGYETVARSTTLPILILGGEASADGQQFLIEMKAALASGPNIRGALVGRNVLYPGDGDPLAAADAVGALIHATGDGHAS